MSTEEDMFEYGFSDANDYVDHLMDQAESEFERMQAQEEEQDRYEAWLSSLTTEEREELEQEKKRKREIKRLLDRQENAKKDELERWFRTENSIDNQIVRCDLYVRHLMGEYKDYEYWKNWLAKKEKFLQWKKENAQLEISIENGLNLNNLEQEAKEVLDDYEKQARDKGLTKVKQVIKFGNPKRVR